MKLRGEIVIDLDAVDFIEAAEHRRQLEMFLENIKTRYPVAALQFRERRKPHTVRVRKTVFEPRIASATKGRE